MNVKKVLLAALAVFIAFMGLDFLIHNVILSADYEAVAELWRTDMMDKMWIMYVTGVVFALLFVYIYLQKDTKAKGSVKGSSMA